MKRISVLFITLVLLIGVLGITPLSAQYWEIVKQQDRELPDNLFFLDSDYGWLVGDNGLIYSTTDGGMTWTEMHAVDPTMEDLKNAFFLNPDSGYIAAEDGVVFKTTDGGATLEAVQDTTVIPEENLYGIWFLDMNTGFVSGNDSIMCKTTDGGQTWTRQTLPNDEDIIVVKFYDAQHGIGIGDGNTGTVIRTSDGGENWELVQVGGLFPPGTISKRLYDLDIAGDNHAIIAGYHFVTLVSSDTGNTWQRVGPYTPEFKRATNCFALDGNTMFSGGTDGFFIRSTDGWASYDSLNSGSGVDIEGMHFFDANAGYLVLADFDVSHLMTTSDGGDTWTPVWDWPNISFWGMAAKSSDELYVTSTSGGEITKTTDGGMTWTYPDNSISGTPSGLYNFEFLNANEAIITGKDGFIAMSNDGGATFQPVQTAATGSFSQFTAIEVVSEDSIWVGSTRGEIFWTFDGGATWTDSLDVGSASIKDIKALDSQNFIACASSGRILKSYDGGITWSEIHDHGTMSFYDMYFFDSNFGYLVSSKGLVWKTEDGGETMAPIDTLEIMGSYSSYLYGIEFSDANNGIIVGDEGAIFETMDGGTTWEQVYSPAVDDLQNVRFVDGKFWAVGRMGTILSYTPTAMLPVTFQVNMGVQEELGNFHPDTNMVVVRGSFQDEANPASSDWSGTMFPLTESGTADVYTIQVTIPDVYVGETFEFKYVIVDTVGESGDQWESISNRSFTLEAGGQVLDVVYFNDQSSVGETADVTFKADMSELVSKGWFDPAEDTLRVVGGFNEWSEANAEVMKRELLNPNMLSSTETITAESETDFEFKFRAAPHERFLDNGWEMGDNHVFTFTGSDQTVGPIKPNIGYAGEPLPQDVTVQFSVYTVDATDTYNNEPFNNIRSVWMKGDKPQLGEWGGSWTYDDTTSIMIRLYDDGTTNGDENAGDGIWTTQVTFPSGTMSAILYKYGIVADGVDTLNDGVSYLDNEAGFGNNHSMVIPGDAAFYEAEVDTFGSQRVETAVKDGKEPIIPTEFALYQNHPNPFNPSTAINYDVPKQSKVTLEIYNILGQKIRTLVDKTQKAGAYSIKWNGKNDIGQQMSTGVYIYRIEAKGFMAVRKMLLMK